MPRIPPPVVRFLTLQSFERNPGRTFLAIGLIFVAAYLAAMTLVPRHHLRIVDGDAIQYYAYLRSLVVDRDLDFTNDYRLLYRDATGAALDGAGDNVWLTSVTPAGRPPNLMSIGPALLWAPAFVIVWIAVAGLRAAGADVPLDGVAAPFQLSAGVAGILYATAGCYLCYRICRTIYPRAAAHWAALVAWLATPAVYYSLIAPAYSHAVSLFAVALFVCVWLRTRDDCRLRRSVLLGALGGLAALVRWQDAIVLLLPVLEILTRTPRGALLDGPDAGRIPARPLASAALRLTVMGLAAGVMMLPQLFAWHAIYGEILLVPQGPGFMRWRDPAVVSVLFSLNHGLFSWTPAVLIGVCGLPLVVHRDRLLGWGAIVIVAVAVYVNASVSDWWAGEAFGARRFVSCLPFFTLGFAAVFAGRVCQAHPWMLRWTAVVLAASNLLFLVQYQLFMRGYGHLVPYPTTTQQVLVDRFTVPWLLLRTWLER
jgi:hypothetical protein